MSGLRLLAEAGRRSGVALLLAVLLLPVLFAGLAEPVVLRGPEEAVLVTPPGPSEKSGGPEGESGPFFVLLPAGLVGVPLDLPEPLSARLDLREADRLSGGSRSSLPPPPPRRA